MNRDFKGIWIPKEVWLDDRLTALEKIILMEIDSLDVGEEGCYASNEYISKFCQCKENKVSNSIKKLVDLKYLEIIKFDGRKRFLRSRLIKKIRQTYSKDKADLFKRYDINIDNNIDDINNNKLLFINNSDNIKKFKKPTIDEIQEYCKERNNNVDAEKFFNYYESNGWKVGKNSMKDWKAAVRTWERNNYDKKDNKKQEVIYDII